MWENVTKILLGPGKNQSEFVNVEINSGNGIGLSTECEKENYHFISYESIIIISPFRKQYEQFHLQNVSLNLFQRLNFLCFNFSTEIINLKLSKCRRLIKLIQRSQNTRFFWIFFSSICLQENTPDVSCFLKCMYNTHCTLLFGIWSNMLCGRLGPSQWYNVPNKNLLPNDHVSSASFKS